MRLVLASASPRRRELLAFLTNDFEIIVSGVEEPLPEGTEPEVVATVLASDKASAVAAANPDALVLAADTIVVDRGEMLGKPDDAEEARAMLRRLRGRTHAVITGVALIASDAGLKDAVDVRSLVRMREYSNDDIEDTIARGVPFDKAGGYGIQDPALAPVQACEGCFCNVMGLPLWAVHRLLRDAGVLLPTDGLPARCHECPARPGD